MRDHAAARTSSDYDYAITWQLEGSRRLTSQGRDSSGVVFVDELPASKALEDVHATKRSVSRARLRSSALLLAAAPAGAVVLDDENRVTVSSTTARRSLLLGEAIVRLDRARNYYYLPVESASSQRDRRDAGVPLPEVHHREAAARAA